MGHSKFDHNKGLIILTVITLSIKSHEIKCRIQLSDLLLPDHHLGRQRRVHRQPLSHPRSQDLDDTGMSGNDVIRGQDI